MEAVLTGIGMRQGDPVFRKEVGSAAGVGTSLDAF